VCGIESRGFLLGGAAALELGMGFVAELVGCAVMVDQTRPSARRILGRVHALVTSEELPDA
jgi:hypothetical protein